VEPPVERDNGELQASSLLYATVSCWLLQGELTQEQFNAMTPEQQAEVWNQWQYYSQSQYYAAPQPQQQMYAGQEAEYQQYAQPYQVGRSHPVRNKYLL
jgi:hypothetical protein